MAMKRGPRRARPGLVAQLRADFLTGLAVVLPVGLTIGLVWWAVGFIDDRITPLVPDAYNPETYLGRDVAGFGLVVFLVFTTLVGALTKGFVGRRILRIAEGWVDRLPVVRSLYNGLKQIVETVFAQSDQSFRQTCLIEYPRKGSWALAFIAADARGELPVKAGEPDLLAVFMPTTPNPTSGFLLFVPRRDVIVLDMSLEDGAKTIISAGLVTPAGKPGVAPPGKPAAAPPAKPAIATAAVPAPR
jgi:uncharacterized membrane protein